MIQEVCSFREPIPITIVTGFLGAGKTTLINRLLKHAAPNRIAVIVNEFGEIGVDGKLIDAGAEELIELANGCICCVVRGDLIRAMRELLANGTALDGVIIETSGVATPGPVVQSLSFDQVLATKCRLDSVLAVVDASRFSALCDEWDQAVDQVMYSDTVLVTRADGFNAEKDDVFGRLRELNPAAEVLKDGDPGFAVADLLNRDSFSHSRVRESLDGTMDATEPENDAHTSTIGSLSLSAEGPLDGEIFVPWLTDLLAQKGESILRTKGIVGFVGYDDAFVVQGVNMMLEIDHAPDGMLGPSSSSLVFIGRGLEKDVLRAGFKNCIAENSSRRSEQCQSL